MQFLAMIASFIFGRLNSRPQGGGIRETVLDLFEDIVLKGRRPVILILAGICAVLFFCGGLFITILEGTTQYDQVGYVTLSSTLGAGIALSLIAALGFAYVFAFAWPGAGKNAAREHVAPPPHQASTLEQALTVLVLDFVREREMRRERENQSAAPGAGSVPPRPAPNKETARDPSSPIH